MKAQMDFELLYSPFTPVNQLQATFVPFSVVQPMLVAALNGHNVGRAVGQDEGCVWWEMLSNQPIG